MSWIEWTYSYYENQDTLKVKEGAIINFARTQVLIRTLLDKMEITVIIDMNNLDKWTPNSWFLINISVWFWVLTFWGIWVVFCRVWQPIGKEKLPEKCPKVGKNFTNIAYFFFCKYQSKSSTVPDQLVSGFLNMMIDVSQWGEEKTSIYIIHNIYLYMESIYIYIYIYQKHIAYSYEFFPCSFSASCKGEWTKIQKANIRGLEDLDRSTRSSAHRKKLASLKISGKESPTFLSIWLWL